MKIAYLDCFSGISGDMLLGALLDANLGLNDLKKGLSKLPLKGYKINAKKVTKNGISATKFIVESNYKQSSLRDSVYKQSSLRDSAEHKERYIGDILKIIEKSSLHREIKELSKKIFIRMASAESKIHNVPVSKIHFHEIGAVDSIVDIVGTVIGIKILGIEKIYSSEIPLGKGFVEFSHGKYPVPAPATIELLKGIPTYQTDISHELVTPTGAGILATLVKDFGNMPKLKPLSIGYGAGSAELENPNVLRIIIGKTERNSEEILTDVVEANIDDMNPEFYNYIMERLFEKGALDVFLANIYMKKNRPGIKLSVISPLDKTEILSKIVIEETTSLGVRIYQTKRICIERDFAKVKTKYGNITVKLGKIGDKIVNIHPEYEDCVKIAKKNNLPLKRVYEIAVRNFKR